MLWKQGKKRRLTIICLALLVLLIGKCCLNGKTEYEAIRFGLDDFAKERDTEYTTWGKVSLLDTGWTEVEPGKEGDYNFSRSRSRCDKL